MDQSRRGFLRLFSTTDGRSRSATSQRQVPVIDGATCNGCDACSGVCEPGAIALARDGAGLAYVARPELCNGCGACVAICDVAAVTVVEGCDAAHFVGRVGLCEGTCRSCGVAFHAPAGQTLERDLCRICAGRRLKLFQVRS